MDRQTLLFQANDWKSKRVAASFERRCNSLDEAYSIQQFLRECGFRPFVQYFGEEINIVMYLIDHKQ